MVVRTLVSWGFRGLPCDVVDVPWGGGELDAGAALVPAELSLWCAFESACVGEYTETLGPPAFCRR